MWSNRASGFIKSVLGWRPGHKLGRDIKNFYVRWSGGDVEGCHNMATGICENRPEGTLKKIYFFYDGVVRHVGEVGLKTSKKS